jgi:hypothetical protein
LNCRPLTFGCQLQFFEIDSIVIGGKPFSARETTGNQSFRSIPYLGERYASVRGSVFDCRIQFPSKAVRVARATRNIVHGKQDGSFLVVKHSGNAHISLLRNDSGNEDSILDLTSFARIFGATSIYFIAKEQ